MNINFDHLKKSVIQLMGKHKSMVLATSFQDHITARTVSCIFDGLTIKLQTDLNFIKVKQIEQNKHVALAWNNVQIEGVATIKGHPFALGNEKFKKTYKEEFAEYFKMYSSLKDQTVIEIEPQIIVIWKYENGKSFRDFLSLTEKKAWRLMCPTE